MSKVFNHTPRPSLPSTVDVLKLIDKTLQRYASENGHCVVRYVILLTRETSADSHHPSSVINQSNSGVVSSFAATVVWSWSLFSLTAWVGR